MFSSGGIIGIFSSLVGLNGGTLSVPFLVYHNTEMHKAIGTAAAIGFPIALSGTLGYVLNGWTEESLPSRLRRLCQPDSLVHRGGYQCFGRTFRRKAGP